MLRILRAFVWLRWRILLNTLERRSSRDLVERFSLAVEQLSPVVMMLVMIPSALALTAVASYAGWSLVRADGASNVPLALVRFVLFAGCVLAVVGPILFPARDRTNAVRLLLLPIPRAVLFLGQVFSALADPWMLLVFAVLAALPAGLLAGGALPGAAAAAAAGLALVAVLAGLRVLMSNVVHLIVRDRRRGEIAALVLILVLPVLGMLPTVLAGGRHGRARGNAGDATAASRSAPREWRAFERTVLAAVPSESYVRGVRAAAESRYTRAATGVVANAGAAVALHALAFGAFARMLAAPGVTRARRRTRETSPVLWRIPGLSPAAAAIARNQVRLAVRTPRGRSTVLSPVVVFAMFALLLSRPHNELGFLGTAGGLGLAAFASAVSLLAVLPLAMNQFAIDGPGLSLLLLLPVGTPSVLAGKAVGNGLIAAMPAAVCLAGALLLYPAGNAWLWACVPLTFAATYVVASPAAAALSALFPRAVDLNSIGNGSNAHGAAGLLGAVAFVAAALPCIAVVFTATALLERPALAPVLLLAWLAIATGVAVVLFNPVRALVDRRRENLAMVVK